MDDTIIAPSDAAAAAKIEAPAKADDAIELALSVIEVLPDAIAAELRDQPHWIVWRLEPPESIGDAPRKMPFQVSGRHAAKSNDPTTWATFDRALAAYRNSRNPSLLRMARAGKIHRATPYSGIGYVFAKDGGMVGVDLDKCRNIQTGELTPWAVEIIERFGNSYAEVSPSGTGVKFWCRARLPINGTGRKVEYQGGAVEVYGHGRYFAATGHKLADALDTIKEAQEAIDWLWAKLFAVPARKGAPQYNGRAPGVAPQDRSRVLERARKYLATLPTAISGQNGSKPTFSAACKLVLGFDLSVGEAFPLLAEYSERCEPPWSEKELQHKLEDADKQPGERGYLLGGRPAAPQAATAIVQIEGAGELSLSITAAKGSKPQREVTAALGAVRHVDRIDVSSASSRKRFVGALAGKAKVAPEAVAAAVEAKLVELGKQADADAQRVERERNCTATFDDADAARYCISEAGCICRLKQTEEGELEIPLCNFSARIVEEVTRDDGAEQRTTLTVEGSLAAGPPLPAVSIGADEFPTMNWPIRVWGAAAAVRAGSGSKDQLREAIQLLSKDVKRQTVYGQTGWRLIGGQWHYLHAGGAITAAGLSIDAATDLPDALARFSLPEPPAGDELKRALLASLRLFDLAPDRIAAPIIAAVYRAPLGSIDHSLFLCGASGAFKSETAALAQQHFGAGFDKPHLPANWASTANAIEGLAFAAADALLVVDDFAPQGGVNDQSRYHREADRVLRAQGNQAGRQRMRADGSLRPAKPPRGLILATGEDVPRGQSLRARMLIQELAHGEISTDRLSACQRDARDGLYAAAMAAYLQWLAPSYAELRSRLSGEVIELRDTLSVGACHARTPGIVADLLIGLRYLLRFVVEAGAVDQRRADDLLQRGGAGILATATSQAKHQQAAEPAQHFGRLLAAVIASGRGHLASINGKAPENHGAWGWREIEVGAGANARYDLHPQGKRIGWTDGDDIYLEPEAAFAEAQRLAGEQGDALAVTPQTLWRRLKERGLLATIDEKRETLKVRKTVEGNRREVLHVADRLLFAENPTNPTSDALAAEATADFAGRVAGRESC